jgi:hypothetical protein
LEAEHDLKQRSLFGSKFIRLMTCIEKVRRRGATDEQHDFGNLLFTFRQAKKEPARPLQSVRSFWSTLSALVTASFAASPQTLFANPLVNFIPISCIFLFSSGRGGSRKRRKPLDLNRNRQNVHGPVGSACSKRPIETSVKDLTVCLRPFVVQSRPKRLDFKLSN